MTTAYEARRHAQRHALDDHDGSRGDVPEAAGVGVDSYVDEDAASQVPGSLPPSYETGDGEVVMSSRCADCGVPLSPRDAPYGGARCAECAGKAMAAPAVKVRTGKPNPDRVAAPKGSAPAPGPGHLLV